MRKFYSIHKNKPNHKLMVNSFNKHINNPNGKTFILIFMEGCGPCNATRPEWQKLKNIVDPRFLDNNNIAIADVDTDLTKDLETIKEASSFPTMRFISNNGNRRLVENYEDSNISSKDRSIDSFVDWIKEKTKEPRITRSEFKLHRIKPYKKRFRMTRKLPNTRRKYTKYPMSRRRRNNLPYKLSSTNYT